MAYYNKSEEKINRKGEKGQLRIWNYELGIEVKINPTIHSANAFINNK